TLWEWDIVWDEIWATNERRGGSGVNRLEKLDFKRFLNSLHPDDRDVVTAAMTKAVKGDGVYESKHRIVRPNGKTSKTEGLGMGLAIVRSIIESHGGTMAVDNPNDGGARFYFTLPVKMGPS